MPISVVCVNQAKQDSYKALSCCHSHTSQLYLSQLQHSEKVAVDEVIRGEKQEVSDLCLTIYVTCGDARKKMSNDFEVRRQNWNYTQQGHNFNGSLNIKKNNIPYS